MHSKILLLILTAFSPIRAKVTTKSINDKFYNYMLYNIKEAQHILSKYTPVSHYTLGTEVIDPLLRQLLVLKVNDLKFFDNINIILVKFRNNYKRVIKDRKLVKRGVFSDYFDNNVREWEDKIQQTDNAYDQILKSWEKDLGKVKHGQVANTKIKSENTLQQGYRMLKQWADPRYYYNWLEGSIYLLKRAQEEMLKTFFQNAGKFLFQGFGGELVRFLNSNEMKQITADVKYSLKDSIPNEFKDHSVIENIKRVAHETGKSAGSGAIDALRQEGGSKGFHVEAAHDSAKAAVRGAFIQVAHYGAISFLILLPFLIVFAAVRLFEMYIYEASDNGFGLV